ncbi:cytochrome c-type biogenesis protein [Bradyrhizobium sp. AUGA SZCCT0283]|jgi:cytochrome c-type biogenesis protein CcmH|uniref:cytochrome c-type biogenesis protein n=1 Tax=Bradyrhizobium sp. AUGA SZCCT0283 TaxID=2807671 RepID=UPI001BAD4944|nr:cytochrome c-type biogenesis protein [Bradyrhizobium sp. AUGA SZCCT0283]MBR1275967.1 cytochrome c-type biogenesis protein CcmH [Bradyrhizobium sp. AUGA SZCCT0283]
MIISHSGVSRSRPRKALLVAAALLGAISQARAVQPDEILKDPALEARARNLSRELRCVVCQNQSIDDSNAPLARDLRVLLRDRLQAGDNDSAAMDFIVARYGNFVLLKPPMQLNTLMLWVGPFLVLIAASLGFGRYIRRSATNAAVATTAAPLDDNELKLVEAILDKRNSA